MSDLTERQKKILLFIKNHMRVKQYPPTRREIMKAFGIKGYFSIHRHLNAMMQKGYIKLIPNIARGIIIIEKGE